MCLNAVEGKPVFKVIHPERESSFSRLSLMWRLFLKCHVDNCVKHVAI